MAARHSWFPYAAAAAGAILLLKASLVMASEDGANASVAGVMYLVGLLLGLAAAVGAGLRRTSRAATFAVAIGGILLLVMWITSLSDVLGGLVALVSDSAVLQDEIPVAVAGVVLIGIGALAFHRDTRAQSARPEEPDLAGHLARG